MPRTRPAPRSTCCVAIWTPPSGGGSRSTPCSPACVTSSGLAGRRGEPQNWRCGRGDRATPWLRSAGCSRWSGPQTWRFFAGGCWRRARRDEPAAEAAAAAADGLASWVGQVGGAPFTGHPFVATIPAERATWDAERTRLTGPSDSDAWSAAAGAWQHLGCPHQAGYARWRQAQAQLDARQPASTAGAALRAAAAAADGHAPLLAQVRLLAERARIPLQPRAAAVTEAPLPARARAPYGLTGRELAVLQLLAAGRTNAQIAADLYISPRTASVHVSSILRKLGVSGRVQAAAIAERAGLLHQGQP